MSSQKIGGNHPNIASKLKQADDNLGNAAKNADAAAAKALDHAAGQLQKAGADVGTAGEAGRTAGKEAIASGFDAGYAAQDFGASAKHGLKGTAFDFAGVAGLVGEGVQRAMAAVSANLGKALAAVVGVMKGTTFTYNQFAADPSAKGFSDRMFNKADNEYAQAKASFLTGVEEAAASIASAGYAAADGAVAVGYLAAAAGHTLVAAKDLGKADIIEAAQGALVLAQGVVMAAEAGNDKVAEKLTQAAIKLVDVSNQLQAAKGTQRSLTVGY